MKLARFWVRQRGEAPGERGRLVFAEARGWSNESPAAAASVACEIASRVAGRLATGESKSKQYEYGDRPLPEPSLYEFPGDAAGPRAVITRNAYGSLVMNTRGLMFVDIDREDAGVPRSIENVAAKHNIAVRIYRTAAGYRALLTNFAFEATSPATEALLREFGSDPLYIRLCKMQESFRARLSPKPWRCGMRPPTVSFPYMSPQEEARFRQWESEYAAAAARYSTCRFVSVCGSGAVHPAFADLVDYHDSETRASLGMPLA